MATLFEHLPDEILLIICQYLSQGQIIFAFLDLNHRLNCTISQFLQSLIILEDQHRQSRRILSLIGPHLNSLTIKQTDLSTAEISLASNIQELTFIHTVPSGIPQLKNLTDLNIFHGPPFESIMALFSKTNDLHSVYIGPTVPLTMPLFSPPKYSTVKQLTITLQSTKDFIRLLDMCPELTCLNLNLSTCNFDEESSFEPHSQLRMFSLRTSYDINVKFDQLTNFFKYLTVKLEYLSIEIETDDLACLDGQLWENCLKENFPQLTRLEFFILFREDDQNHSQPLRRLPAILKTFQGAYWSTIVPQKVIGYYNHIYAIRSTCIHTDIIPTVHRRRYFLY